MFSIIFLIFTIVRGCIFMCLGPLNSVEFYFSLTKIKGGWQPDWSEHLWTICYTVVQCKVEIHRDSHVHIMDCVIPLPGFNLYYKKQHGDWKSLDLQSHDRSCTIESLSCGTQYTFHIRAHNKMGEGLPSQSVMAKTNGSGTVTLTNDVYLWERN